MKHRPGKLDLTGAQDLKPTNRKPSAGGFLREIRPAFRKYQGNEKVSQRASGRGALRLGHANSQRVIVKAKFVRSRPGNGVGALRKHVAYLERTGTAEDGGRAVSFGSNRQFSSSEIKAIVREWENNRHHFRFIVSPEQAQRLNLEGFTRAFVCRMEHSLRTDLQWFAVAHHNTDNPHVHLIVRGQTDRGFDLVIDKEYMCSGLRMDAQEAATLILGRRTERDRNLAMEREVSALRFTSLDKALLTESCEKGSIEPSSWKTKGQIGKRMKIYQLARLQYLEGLELAARAGPTGWKLSEQFEGTLKELGMKHDIIKTKARETEIER